MSTLTEFRTIDLKAMLPYRSQVLRATLVGEELKVIALVPPHANHRKVLYEFFLCGIGDTVKGAFVNQTEGRLNGDVAYIFYKTET